MMKRIVSVLVILLLMMTFLATTSVALAGVCVTPLEFGDTFCKDRAVTSRSWSRTTDPTWYTVPAVPKDSLFGRRQYGRLADNANVYASATRSSTVIRNVGDGYLFASVRWQFANDAGETWYEINYGEYVHGDDLRLVTASDFQGVQIDRQPERPFGWVVQEVAPSNTPDGDPDPAFEMLSRYQFVEVYETAVGQGGWIWYMIGDNRWVKQTYLSVVDVDARPESVGAGEFWVEVDLYEQTFAAYEGEQMVYATLISSGLNRWPTYEGIFQVEEDDRFLEYRMSGAEGRVDYYFLEDIPYIMYFDAFNGIALHGTYWHDRFGFKHSHGCVNMTIKDAGWAFDWSAEAPNALWVWVHTSAPATHLPASR